MTGKADFTPEEWELVLEGPPSAGLVVIAAQRGGTFRETVSMAKAYVDARKEHGASQLLDEIVSGKPEVDHERFQSAQELRDTCLDHLRRAVAVLDEKASPDEAAEYRRFVLTLARRVAGARRDGFLGLSGERVSESEEQAVAAVADALGAAGETGSAA